MVTRRYQSRARSSDRDAEREADSITDRIHRYLEDGYEQPMEDASPAKDDQRRKKPPKQKKKAWKPDGTDGWRGSVLEEESVRRPDPKRCKTCSPRREVVTSAAVKQVQKRKAETQVPGLAAKVMAAPSTKEKKRGERGGGSGRRERAARAARVEAGLPEFIGQEGIKERQRQSAKRHKSAVEELREQVQELRTRLDRYESSQPAASSSSRPAAPATEPPVEEEAAEDVKSSPKDSPPASPKDESSGSEGKMEQAPKSSAVKKEEAKAELKTKMTYAEVAKQGSKNLNPSAKSRPASTASGSAYPIVVTWDYNGTLSTVWDEKAKRSTDDAFWTNLALSTQTNEPLEHDLCSFIGFGDLALHSDPRTRTQSKQHGIEEMVRCVNAQFGADCPGGRVINKPYIARQKTGVSYWSKRHRQYALSRSDAIRCHNRSSILIDDSNPRLRRNRLLPWRRIWGTRRFALCRKRCVPRTSWCEEAAVLGEAL